MRPLAPLYGLIAGLQSTLRHAFGLADAMEPRVEARLQQWLSVEERPQGSVRRVVAAQTQSVLTVVVLGIIILLGTLIYSEVFEAVFPSVDNDPANNTQLEDAASNATTDYGDAMELAPVIMIVLIAAVVLGVVQRFR